MRNVGGEPVFLQDRQRDLDADRVAVVERDGDRGRRQGTAGQAIDPLGETEDVKPRLQHPEQLVERLRRRVTGPQRIRFRQNLVEIDQLQRAACTAGTQ
jgi:hypothetical protein